MTGLSAKLPLLGPAYVETAERLPTEKSHRRTFSERGSPSHLQLLPVLRISPKQPLCHLLASLFHATFAILPFWILLQPRFTVLDAFFLERGGRRYLDQLIAVPEYGARNQSNAILPRGSAVTRRFDRNDRGPSRPILRRGLVRVKFALAICQNSNDK